MAYQIVYDKGGRLRVRLGRRAFSKAVGFEIQAQLMGQSWIGNVRTNAANGGILIEYEVAHKDELLKWMAKISRQVVQPIQVESSAHHQTLVRDLTIVMVRHFLTKWCVPFSIRKWITFGQSIVYLKKGLASLIQQKMNVEVLDATALGVALWQKDVNTASSVMLLLGISHTLEAYTKQKAQVALSERLSFHVDRVWLIQEDEDEVLVPLKSIAIGDLLQIRTGFMIPVDGEVVRGEAFVNESSFTGEPLGVMRRAGHRVYAGTVVEEGSIVIAVKTLVEGSRIQHILSMIESSELLKASLQAESERLADSVVPISFASFFLSLLLTRSLSRSLSVLMVDYACAIKLTIPISIITALRQASSRSILIKGARYLEAFDAAEVMVFDKTGTLTKTTPSIAKIETFSDYNQAEVLRISACLEEHFPHSLANAIVEEAHVRGLRHDELHGEVAYVVAHGIASTINGEKALIGSFHFVFEDERVPLSECQRARIDVESEHYSTVFLAIAGQLVGMICVTNPVRLEARRTLDRLKQLGIHQTVMLTGDSDFAARDVCEKLGISTYHAGLLPEEKADVIRSFQQKGHRVIMVGDGVNDSPALSVADVSVVMNDASDLAKEVANITLLSRDLHQLITLRLLSREMTRRIKRNYQAIIGANTLLIGLGLKGILSTASAAFAHNALTLALCVTSMRDYALTYDGMALSNDE